MFPFERPRWKRLVWRRRWTACHPWPRCKDLTCSASPWTLKNKFFRCPAYWHRGRCTLLKIERSSVCINHLSLQITKQRERKTQWKVSFDHFVGPNRSKLMLYRPIKVSFCAYDNPPPPKKYTAHAWQHSIDVWLLGQSSCSFPSTKEVRGSDKHVISQ